METVNDLDRELMTFWRARTNQGGSDNARTEVVWCNRPLGTHPALFDLAGTP